MIAPHKSSNRLLVIHMLRIPQLRLDTLTHVDRKVATRAGSKRIVFTTQIQVNGRDEMKRAVVSYSELNRGTLGHSLGSQRGQIIISIFVFARAWIGSSYKSG